MVLTDSFQVLFKVVLGHEGVLSGNLDHFDDAEDASVEVEEGKSEMMPSTKTFVSFIPFQKSCQQ